MYRTRRGFGVGVWGLLLGLGLGGPAAASFDGHPQVPEESPMTAKTAAAAPYAVRLRITGFLARQHARDGDTERALREFHSMLSVDDPAWPAGEEGHSLRIARDIDVAQMMTECGLHEHAMRVLETSLINARVHDDPQVSLIERQIVATLESSRIGGSKLPPISPSRLAETQPAGASAQTGRGVTHAMKTEPTIEYRTTRAVPDLPPPSSAQPPTYHEPHRIEPLPMKTPKQSLLGKLIPSRWKKSGDPYAEYPVVSVYSSGHVTPPSLPPSYCQTCAAYHNHQHGVHGGYPHNHAHAPRIHAVETIHEHKPSGPSRMTGLLTKLFGKPLSASEPAPSRPWHPKSLAPIAKAEPELNFEAVPATAQPTEPTPAEPMSAAPRTFETARVIDEMPAPRMPVAEPPQFTLAEEPTATPTSKPAAPARLQPAPPVGSAPPPVGSALPPVAPQRLILDSSVEAPAQTETRPAIEHRSATESPKEQTRVVGGTKPANNSVPSPVYETPKRQSVDEADGLLLDAVEQPEPALSEIVPTKPRVESAPSQSSSQGIHVAAAGQVTSPGIFVLGENATLAGVLERAGVKTLRPDQRTRIIRSTERANGNSITRDYYSQHVDGRWGRGNTTPVYAQELVIVDGPGIKPVYVAIMPHFVLQVPVSTEQPITADQTLNAIQEYWPTIADQEIALLRYNDWGRATKLNDPSGSAGEPLEEGDVLYIDGRSLDPSRVLSVAEAIAKLSGAKIRKQ